MGNAITRNYSAINCKPEVLEGYWLKTMLEAGNKVLAKLCVTNGAKVIQIRRLKSDPGVNLLS